MTFSLIDDPDVGHVDSERARSWGSFELVVRGVDLTETVQQGQSVRAAHWFLLPVVEWLAERWAAILHEPGMPVAGG